jgi:hypothetical protein
VYTSAAMDLDVNVWQLWASGLGSCTDPVHPRTASDFDGYLPLTPARFPNARLSDDSVFDSAPSANTGRTNGSML